MLEYRLCNVGISTIECWNINKSQFDLMKQINTNYPSKMSENHQTRLYNRSKGAETGELS